LGFGGHIIFANQIMDDFVQFTNGYYFLVGQFILSGIQMVGYQMPGSTAKGQ
jgi:hypothetical protein